MRLDIPEIDWTNIDSSWHNFKQLSFLLWCLRFVFEVFVEEMRILQGKFKEITIKLNGAYSILLIWLKYQFGLWPIW